jgi:hypothetical protein
MRKTVILPTALLAVGALTVVQLAQRFVLPLVLDLETTFPTLKAVWSILNTGTI